MDTNQMLQQTGAVQAISRELGVDPATAQAGAAALLPSILSGFQNPVGSGQARGTADASPGLGGLMGMIGGLGGAGLLDNVTSDQPTAVGKGDQILGHIFGSREGSRAVAASAAGQSGVEPSLLKKMLPILAMVAAGYVMKQAGHGGGQGGGNLGGGGLGGGLGGGGLGGGGLGGALGGELGGMLGGGNSGAGQGQASSGGGLLGDLIGAAGRYLGR